MKVILITSNYPTNWGKKNLLSDLVQNLGDRGHVIEVLSNNYSQGAQRGILNLSKQVSLRNLGGFRLHFSKFTLPINLLLGSFEIWLLLLFKKEKYDLCIFTSIGIINLFIPWTMKSLKVSEKILFVLWDFFPIHQQQIGHWRFGPFSNIFKFIERTIIASADVISVMSAANLRFFREYHKSLGGKKYISLPPWSSSGESRGQDTRIEKFERYTVLFGGQLTAGRGIINLLRGFQIVQARNSSIDLVIAGDGPDREELVLFAKELKLSNVKFMGQLEREDFRVLARQCHLGVAITDSRVTPPSFPSKIPEYLGLGLPVIAGLEASSDAMDLLLREGIGSTCSPDNPNEISESILQWFDRNDSFSREQIQQKARLLYQEEFSVQKASERIELICLN
jgi:glycosyltransferase involved in cell wall biosynthesis